MQKTRLSEYRTLDPQRQKTLRPSLPSARSLPTHYYESLKTPPICQLLLLQSAILQRISSGNIKTFSLQDPKYYNYIILPALQIK